MLKWYLKDCHLLKDSKSYKWIEHDLPFIYCVKALNLQVSVKTEVVFVSVSRVQKGQVRGLGNHTESQNWTMLKLIELQDHLRVDCVSRCRCDPPCSECWYIQEESASTRAAMGLGSVVKLDCPLRYCEFDPSLTPTKITKRGDVY